MDYIPKTNWVYGEILSHEAMNRIEGGIGFAVEQTTGVATLNADWEAGSAIGLEFKKVGNLIIANFAAAITNITGVHMFIGTIPEGFRPSVITPLPAVFVPAGSADYHPRMVVVNTDGTIQIANSPTEIGTFFCAMVYFVEQLKCV